MRTLTAGQLAQLTADSRAPRLAATIAFPSGTVNLTTGKPVTISGTAYTHVGFEVSDLDSRSAGLRFYQGQTPFASDFGNAASLGAAVSVGIYYEIAGTLVAADITWLFAGVIVDIEDGENAADAAGGQVEHRFPPRRWNAQGGVTVQSQPGIVTLGNTTVFISRRALS